MTSDGLIALVEDREAPADGVALARRGRRARRSGTWRRWARGFAPRRAPLRAVGAGRPRARHPFAHLAGGLVGERQRHDGSRGDAALDEARDAVGDDARLARTRAREDEERAVAVLDGLALRAVQTHRGHLGVLRCAARGLDATRPVHATLDCQLRSRML